MRAVRAHRRRGYGLSGNGVRRSARTMRVVVSTSVIRQLPTASDLSNTLRGANRRNALSWRAEPAG